jgi:hypothetical protein
MNEAACRWTRRALWGSFAGAVAVALWFLLLFLQERAVRDHEGLRRAKEAATRAAAAIEKSFREARDIGESIAGDLSRGTLSYGAIEERMRKDCAARADINGIAVTFQPFAYDPGLRLYQEYVFRKPDGTLDILKGATYDYSQAPSENPGGPKTAWFHTPLQQGPLWMEPFLATGAGDTLIEYGTTFRKTNDAAAAAGVVTVDFSLRDLQLLVARLELGTTGYGMVFTSKGTFIAHPDRDQVIHGSIERAEALLDPGVQAAAKAALAGKASSLPHLDPVTGVEGWVLFEPIPSTGWVLGLSLQKDDETMAPLEMQERLTELALAASLALLLGIALLVRVERGTEAGLWTVSNALSALCWGLILLTWILAWDSRRTSGSAIATRTSIERVFERHRASLTRQEECHTVPTGLELTSVRFPDAGSVTLGGHVWQRWPKSAPPSVRRGFSLPQLVAEEVLVEEVQRIDRGAEELIVWRVVATLQQSFDPRLYPFDRRDVSVKIRPAEVAANVVLTPDLESYPMLAPRALPGLARGLRVSNWHFQESFFSFKADGASSSLGLREGTNRAATPSLHFNVAARRHYLGPFIAYLLPALVAAGLTFAFLMSRSEAETPGDLLNGLSYIAALFFVIVVAHSALRENINAVSITYLEHLFIELYVMVGLVVLDAFAVVYAPQFWLVRWRRQLAAKLVFWPLVTGVLLASTLAVFVYS